MSGTCAIAVFARAPVAGQCKTRLIPRLGADGAALLQEKLVEHALKVAVAADVGPVVLWCEPDDAHAFFQRCRAQFGICLKIQSGAELGARMDQAFRDAAGPMLLMGSDCPSITPVDLRDCAAALQATDAVFLPAEDGGYGLVGLNEPSPEIFSNMQWSTPQVMAQTIARLQRAGRQWREIRTIWDVDEPADYDRLVTSGTMDV